MNEYIVYAKSNDSGYITAINSSAFLVDLTGWIEIDRGMGDKYHHAQGNYLSGPLMTDGGAWRYKLDNGRIALCTDAEVGEQEKFAAQVLDWKDTMEAQILYTAMMTNTMLEV